MPYRPRKQEQSHENPSIKTPLLNRSPAVRNKLVRFRPLVPMSMTGSDESVTHPLWKRVSTLYDVDFTFRAPANACFSPGSITKVTGVYRSTRGRQLFSGRA